MALIALVPEILKIAIAPEPGGVACAKIESSLIIYILVLGLTQSSGRGLLGNRLLKDR